MEMYRTDQVYSNMFYNVSYNIDSHTAIVHCSVYLLIYSWILKYQAQWFISYSFGVWIGPWSDACSNNFYNAWCAIKTIAI